MTDSKIVELFWRRNEEAISESSEKYGKYCHYIAHNILYSNEDAEECVNDTWMNAWRSIPPHKPMVLRTFLGKITRNLALNKYERKLAGKRGGGETTLSLDELQDCIPDKSNLDQLADHVALTNILNAFLLGEQEDSRNIFIQRYWFMCSIKEISENFGFSESKVKMTLLREREKLRHILQREGFAE